MNKLYLDLRTVSAVPNPYLASAKDLMSYSGANIGNFAFRHALKSMINIDEYQVVDYNGFNKEVAAEKPSSVVISCANWLCATEAYEKSNEFRAAIIEKADCPISVFGLGAQAKENQADFKLGPNTERLAKVISERSTLVSVRDEFTLTVLEKLGITNAVVTGCPSNFINLDPMLGQKILKKGRELIESKLDWADLKMHFTEFSGGHESSGKVLANTLELLNESPSFYVIQSPVLLPFLLNETDEIPPGYISNKPKSIAKTAEFRRFLKSKVMHFSAIDAWMDFSRTCDLSIGMRIHGNILPLQAGVPSVVIGHDSRTSGLSNTMGIPVVTPEMFVESVCHGPIVLLEKINNTMQDYDNRRSVLGKVFYDYIVENGLAPTNSLSCFLSEANINV